MDAGHVAFFFLAGLVTIEIVGYIYHRFFEHGEIMRVLRTSGLIKKIIYLHWTHHYKLYPPQSLRREGPYATEDNLSWYVPGSVATVLVFLLAPWPFAISYSLGGWSYGLFVDWLHERFHLKSHILAKTKVFLYLQRIHDIHHINPNKNFTIVFPLLDIVFGTYEGALVNSGTVPSVDCP